MAKETFHRSLRPDLRFDPDPESLRALADRGGNLLGALGIFLVAGVVIAGIATWIFSELAERVMGGGTQAFDDMVLRWVGAKPHSGTDGATLEITRLGTTTTVVMIVGVAALFLTLTKHKYSALLLVVATAGRRCLDLVLKLRFDRPRPHLCLGTTGRHVVVPVRSRNERHHCLQYRCIPRSSTSEAALGTMADAPYRRDSGSAHLHQSCTSAFTIRPTFWPE